MSKETLKDALVKKAEQIRTAAETILAKTRDWQIIKNYISNRVSKIELTEGQELKLERYQFIYNQIVSGKYLESEIVSLVIKIYNVGIAQAYEDINSTKELFETVINIKKVFDLKISLEGAKDMLRRAIEVGDFKAEAMARRAINDVHKLLPDEVEEPSDLFDGHTIEATFDPRLLGGVDISPDDMKSLFDSINAKRKVKIKTEMFEEISHENVNPKEDNPL